MHLYVYICIYVRHTFPAQIQERVKVDTDSRLKTIKTSDVRRISKEKVVYESKVEEQKIIIKT